MQRLTAASFRAWCAFMLVCCLLSAVLVSAQGGSGQFWVQMFEDRNGNGIQDSEPPITRGASVELLNSEGVVIATAMMDNSPFADRGLVGFRFLPPGEYTIVVTSPEFTPTTETSFTRTLNEGDVLPPVTFGAQQAATGAAATSEAAGDFATQALNDLSRRGQIARIALAALGAVIVAGLMVLLGAVIYALVLRRRYKAQMRKMATSTGSMPRIRTTDTGQIQRS
jgi:hypothetical protein